MTYFGFLLRFLIIPILLLLFITWRQKERPTPGFVRRLVWAGIFVHVFLALAYTTPWDNYLVATGVWYYNPDLVTGILLGYVPIEEYTFFVLETVLTGLWWLFLARRLPDPGAFKPSQKARLVPFAALFVAWVFFVVLFFSGWQPGTYLAITLSWAFPAIFPQLLFGADILWHHRKLVVLTILVPGTYLSLMDIVALRESTWSISPKQTTGVLFFGILPLEEVIFFFITNVLIGFGMTLMLSTLGQQRLRAWQTRLFPTKKENHVEPGTI